MIPVMYGNNYQIIQSPGFVVITYEIVHESARDPARRPVRTSAAASARTWEIRAAAGTATRSSSRRRTSRARLRIETPTPKRSVSIERFTRVAPDRIEWTATLDDPKTWTSPWTIAMPLTADPTADNPGVRVPRAQLRIEKHPQRSTRLNGTSNATAAPPRYAVALAGLIVPSAASPGLRLPATRRAQRPIKRSEDSLRPRRYRQRIHIDQTSLRRPLAR